MGSEEHQHSVGTRQLSQQLRQAIDRSREWAAQGWPISFGHREVLVSSLAQAEALAAAEMCRPAAINYWRLVAELGEQTATWGEKALVRQAARDFVGAANALYYAAYLERQLGSRAGTWQVLVDSLQHEPAWSVGGTGHQDKSGN